MRALLLFVTLSALHILGSGADKMGRKWQSLKALTQGHRLPRAARLLRETELKSALKAPSSGILHHSYRPCTLAEVDGGVCLVILPQTKATFSTGPLPSPAQGSGECHPSQLPSWWPFDT